MQSDKIFKIIRMKILVFTGGLGNQIFGYVFYQYLQNIFPEEKVYGIYNKSKMSEHFGLEIDKYFNVNLPSSPLWVRLYTLYLYCLKKTHLCKSKVSMDTRNFNQDSIINNACKMHIDYILQSGNLPKFKKIVLCNQNKVVLSEIKSTHSVFVHVRRGDYYSPKYIDRLGGTCPKEYYEKAIKYIVSRDSNARFFVFSDDIEYVKNNIYIPNPTYVDWNKGKDSYLDMYLMSNCRHAIIANSTFSFWGAMLGNKKEIVTYPTKWVNKPATAPQIFPNEWVTF